MRTLALLTLAACADLPENTALVEAPPPPFALDLWTSPWIAGGTARAVVRGAVPGDTVRLLFGAGGQSCPAPLHGACVDLASPTPIASAVAGPTGQAAFTVPIPAGAPVGADRTMQAVANLRGVASVSNPWESEVVASCPGADGCNLVGNADLDNLVAPWRPVPGVVTLAWSPRDRLGAAASGALEVTNIANGSYSSAWQCAPVRAGDVYDYRGWGYLPAAAAGAYLFAEYIFYTNDDCTGGLVAFDESPWDPTLQTWVQIGLQGIVTPAGAGSVRVGHGLIDFGLGNITATFDDLVLTRR